jgi:hypothetical protein
VTTNATAASASTDSTIDDGAAAATGSTGDIGAAA